MSVIQGAIIQACYQSAAEGKALEKRISSVILNVYQSTGIEKEDGSTQSLENHATLDQIRWLSNKKFEKNYDVIAAWLWQKTTPRDPRSEESVSMCPV